MLPNPSAGNMLMVYAAAFSTTRPRPPLSRPVVLTTASPGRG